MRDCCSRVSLTAARWNALSSTRCVSRCGLAAWLSAEWDARGSLSLRLRRLASSSEKPIHLSLRVAQEATATTDHGSLGNHGGVGRGHGVRSRPRRNGSHCGLHAAKHAAASRAGKDKSSRIDRQCPNISTSLLRPTAAPKRGPGGQRPRLQLIIRHSSLITFSLPRHWTRMWRRTSPGYRNAPRRWSRPWGGRRTSRRRSSRSCCRRRCRTHGSCWRWRRTWRRRGGWRRRRSAGQRIDIGTAAACPDRETCATPVNLHVPYHRVWQTVFETLPRRGCYRDVVGKVNAPVRAGIDLLRLIGIDDDGVDRNIREIAGLVRPGKRAATCCARYLEYVTRCRWRVSVEAANSRVPHW
jgi:hypothetical protein